MKKTILLICVALFAFKNLSAQIDLENISLDKILGKVLDVQRGFAPKFSLGSTPIKRIAKVAEIFGLKGNGQAMKLFGTFRTGRTVYRIASYAGSAIAAYGAIKAANTSATKSDYQGAILSGLSSIGTGLIIKFLTKSAAYKAVDIFNGAVRRKIKDIFSIAPASSTMGMGVYVKL